MHKSSISSSYAFLPKLNGNQLLFNYQACKFQNKLLDEKKYKEEWSRIKVRKATEGMDNEFDKYANKEQSIIKYKVKGRNFTKLL